MKTLKLITLSMATLAVMDSAYAITCPSVTDAQSMLSNKRGGQGWSIPASAVPNTAILTGFKQAKVGVTSFKDWYVHCYYSFKQSENSPEKTDALFEIGTGYDSLLVGIKANWSYDTPFGSYTRWWICKKTELSACAWTGKKAK